MSIRTRKKIVNPNPRTMGSKRMSNGDSFTIDLRTFIDSPFTFAIHLMNKCADLFKSFFIRLKQNLIEAAANVVIFPKWNQNIHLILGRKT
jgi:hypothetical protein